MDCSSHAIMPYIVFLIKSRETLKYFYQRISWIARCHERPNLKGMSVDPLSQLSSLELSNIDDLPSTTPSQKCFPGILTICGYFTVPGLNSRTAGQLQPDCLSRQVLNNDVKTCICSGGNNDCQTANDYKKVSSWTCCASPASSNPCEPSNWTPVRIMKFHLDAYTHE